MQKLIAILTTSILLIIAPTAQSQNVKTLKVATFNVSMEAFNYLKDRKSKPSGTELALALQSGHQQVKNIAEIIQRVNPDIILLNEFDRIGEDSASLKIFISDYLAQSQNGQSPIHFPYYYQGPSNTGVVSNVDFNDNQKNAEIPADTYGFGYFPGHFGMALLSKYPLDDTNIRTFQLFKWKDMPDALKPFNPETQTSYYSEEAWDVFRLSSKSMWDIPVIIGDKVIHILASHPTPPVFDGPEDRNGKRNHDEIRLVADYITPDSSSYIYDDKQVKGGLPSDKAFVILGDLNASNVDGDAINDGIERLLLNPAIIDPKPESEGGKLHAKENEHGKNHTAFWGMRADYVLPSAFGFNVKSSGVFWPAPTTPEFRLVADRTASSDHRLVWVELELN